MRCFLGWVVVTVTALTAPTAMAAEWGDLKVRFVYGGDPPEPAKIQPTTDAAHCGQHDLVDERLLVHKENRGIQNVTIYVYTGRGGSKLPIIHPGLVGKKDVEVTTRNCRLEPRIAVMQAGDDLLLNLTDEVGHNINLSFFKNSPTGFTIPISKDRTLRRPVPEAEPAPIPMECNIHPWMKGYLVVADHPYAAVSDENGVLLIKNLPAGDSLSFRVWHEAGRRFEGVEMGSERISRVNRVELEIAPGMNDLGEITLSAEFFRHEITKLPGVDTK